MEAIDEEGPIFKRVKIIIAHSKMKTLFRDSDDEDQDVTVPSYNETEKILEQWEAIRTKYAPETDSYAKVNMFNALANKEEDKFEYQERIEERKKYNFYNRRSKLNIPEIINLAQYRLSLFSVFNITDDLDLAALKVKKVRNQLGVVKD